MMPPHPIFRVEIDHSSSACPPPDVTIERIADPAACHVSLDPGGVGPQLVSCLREKP
jgi:hypothetical protein